MPSQVRPKRAPQGRSCRSCVKAMERVIQWLDDLDDLIGVVGLAAEHIRRFCVAVGLTIAAFLLQLGGILLALAHPPIALATVIIMFVTLLYRSVTNPLEIA